MTTEPSPVALIVEDEASIRRFVRVALQAEGWFVYRFLDGSVRFMCSWATTEAAVEEMAGALRRIA